MFVRIVAAVAVTGLLAVAAPALAVTKNGITPVSPKRGATVDLGKSPTFKFRSRGGGSRWVHVCKSARRDGDGVICHKESIGRAGKKGSVWRYKPRFFDYPGFWLNRPGTYYWQAFRIADCRGNDCKREGPVVRFKVG